MNNTNNDTTIEEQMLMLQTLQAQMQELQQKGVADQLHQEEERRKQEEERHRQAEEMVQLKEQNKRLFQRLEESEREGHSHTPISTPHTHQSKTKPPTPQTQGAHHVSHTHHMH